VRVACTCTEYGTDLACPQHGPAENARQLKKAKRELRLLPRMLQQGVPFEAARTKAHEMAWGKMLNGGSGNPLRAILEDASFEVASRRDAWKAAGRWRPRRVRAAR
jgi:hypothetical protein